jgi:hypothetical protein
VRLPLHWEEFQPRPERIAMGALRPLEQVLDIATDARLRVVPQLMPVAVGGAIHLPAWTTAASYAADMTLSTKFGPLVIVRNEQRPPLVWERTEHKTEVRDLWTNPTMREAQRKLIGEVVGYFGDHPTISGWELGSGIELGRPPSSPDAATDWLGETADVARQNGARGTLYYAATLRSLLRREGPRPDAFTAANTTLALSLMPSEPAFKSQTLTVEMLQFVAALVRSLAGTPPVLIFGAPSVTNGRDTIIADRAYGRDVEQPLLDHDEYARLVETALPALQADAVPAAWFAHAFCYEQPAATSYRLQARYSVLANYLRPRSNIHSNRLMSKTTGQIRQLISGGFGSSGKH